MKTSTKIVNRMAMVANGCRVKKFWESSNCWRSGEFEPIFSLVNVTHQTYMHSSMLDTGINSAVAKINAPGAFLNSSVGR